MNNPVREQLLGYWLGALDDSEMEEVSLRLQTDEEYRRQWMALRREWEPLDGLPESFHPPEGLAGRTCRQVFSQPKAVPVHASRGLALTPLTAPPSWVSRVGWLDAAVAIAVFVTAGLLVFPAIQHSRFQSRVAGCSDNLRELGASLAAYSRANDNRFPQVPTEGNLAAAGIYAPKLIDGGFLAESRRVLCPDAAVAANGDFRIPSLEELQRAEPDRAAVLRRQMGGNYGYCRGYVADGKLRGTKNLARTSFALMADAPQENLPSHQTANHGGLGQNVLFEDGHVEFLAKSQPFPEADDIFANDDLQVAAGVHRNDSVIASSDTAPVVYAARH